MNMRLVNKVSSNSDITWSSVYGFKSDILYPDTRPYYEMLMVTRITTEADINRELVGKMLVEEVQNSFEELGQKHSDIVVRLEDSLWKMKSKLEALLSKDEYVMEKGLDMEMSIVVLSEGILYAGVIGESKIFLVRKEKVVEISKGLIDSNMMGFAKTGSLKLQFEDRVILGTANIFGEELDNIVNLATSLDLNILKKINDVAGGSFILLADSSLNWIEESSPVDNFDDLSTETSVLDVTANEREETVQNQYGEYDSTSDSEVEEVFEENDTNFSEYDGVDFNKDDETQDTKSIPESEFNYNDDFDLEKKRNLTEQEPKKTTQSISNSVISTLKNLSLATRKFYKKNIINNKKTYIKVLESALVQVRKLYKFFFRSVSNFLNGGEQIPSSVYGRRSKVQQGNFRKRNRRILFIGLLILFVFLFLNFRSAEFERQQEEKLAALQSDINNFNQQLNNLDRDSVSVNAQSIDYKRELVRKADSLSKDIRDKINEHSKDPELQRRSAEQLNTLNLIISDVNKLRNRVLLIDELTSANLRLVSDIGRQFPNSNITSIAFTGITGQRLIYASDNKNNNVYKVNVDQSGSVSLVQGGNFTGPRLLLRDGSGNIIVYDNSEGNSISRILATDNDSVQKISVPYQDTTNVVKSKMFASNGSLYELRNTPNSYIHRRSPSGSGFVVGGANYVVTNPPNWRTDADFANAIDIAVPYEVYVLIKGQGVKRYLSGGDNSINQQTYSNILPEDFEEIKRATAMDASGKYMAIGDSLNRRVMVFEITQDSRKDLVFKKQFKYSGSEAVFNNIKELFINDLQGGGAEIYVLDGNKVILLNI